MDIDPALQSKLQLMNDLITKNLTGSEASNIQFSSGNMSSFGLQKTKLADLLQHRYSANDATTNFSNSAFVVGNLEQRNGDRNGFSRQASFQDIALSPPNPQKVFVQDNIIGSKFDNTSVRGYESSTYQNENLNNLSHQASFKDISMSPQKKVMFQDHFVGMKINDVQTRKILHQQNLSPGNIQQEYVIQIDTLKAETVELRGEVSKLTSQLQYYQNIEKNFRDTQNEIIKLRQENANLTLQFRNLKLENEGKDQMLKLSEDEIQTMRTAHQQALKKLETNFNQELAALKAQHQQIFNEIVVEEQKRSQQKQNQLDQENFQMKQRVEQLKEEVESLHLTINHLVQNNQERQKLIENLQKERQTLQVASRQSDTQIKELKQDNEELSKQLENMKHELQRLGEHLQKERQGQQNANKLDTQVKELKKENEDLRRKLDLVHQDHKHMLKKKDDLHEAKLKVLIQDNDKKDQHIKQHQNNLQEHLDNHKKELEKKHQNEKQKLVDALIKEEEHHHNHRRAREKLELEVEQMKAEIRRLKNRVDDQSIRNDELTAQLKKEQQQHQDVVNTLQKKKDYDNSAMLREALAEKDRELQTQKQLIDRLQKDLEMWRINAQDDPQIHDSNKPESYQHLLQVIEGYDQEISLLASKMREQKDTIVTQREKIQSLESQIEGLKSRASQI